MAASNVRQLPSATAPAVQNPQRRGRYPRGVVSLQQARNRRSLEAFEPKQAQAKAAAALDDEWSEVIFIPRRTYPKGTRLYVEDGRAVIVVKDFNVCNVRNKSARLERRFGYVCEVEESGEQFFYQAGELFDGDGQPSHLRLV